MPAFCLEAILWITREHCRITSLSHGLTYLLFKVFSWVWTFNRNKSVVALLIQLVGSSLFKGTIAE